MYIEQKKKLKNWKKAENLGEYAVKGSIPWNKGVPRTQAEKKNISTGRKKCILKNGHPKGMLGKKHSEGTKRRIAENSSTPEMLARRQIAFKEYCKNKRVLFKCSVCGAESMITRKRAKTQKYCSYACLGASKRTQNQAMAEKIRGLKEYGTWRSSVFDRDGYLCTACKNKKNNRLCAHHKIPLSVLVKVNKITSRKQALETECVWDLANGVTLCEACHKKTDSYLKPIKAMVTRHA